MDRCTYHPVQAAAPMALALELQLQLRLLGPATDTHRYSRRAPRCEQVNTS